MKKINWRYALGEILIVIIGITIAFNLNNFSENKKNKQLRDQYLESIQKDLIEDKQQLLSNKKLLEEKTENLSVVLKALRSDNDTEKRKVMGIIFKVAEIIEFNPKNVTYHSLINSGDMKLIKNFELKNAIEAHYSLMYEEIAASYFRQENINKKYLADYFINHLNYENLGKGEYGFENERLLISIFQSTYGSVQMKITSTEKGIASCEKLIKLTGNN